MPGTTRHPRPSGHPIVVEVSIQAPLQRVWGALRDPAEIRRWHGWESPALDEEIDIIYRRTATISDTDFTLETGAGRFELEPLGEATVVRICRPAPEGSPGWEGVVDEINEGWLSFVQQLRFYLERHAGRPRRSVRVQHVRQLPTGEVFFTSAHQTGLVLDDAALLVISPQHMTLNAYGMDEGDFASLRARLVG